MSVDFVARTVEALSVKIRKRDGEDSNSKTSRAHTNVKRPIGIVFYDLFLFIKKVTNSNVIEINIKKNIIPRNYTLTYT